MTIWEQRRAWAGVAALLVGTLVVVSCADDDLTGASDLMGGRWQLQTLALAGAAEFTPPDPSRFAVSFTGEGRVEVTADCNSCGGAFSVGEDSLTVPELTCTLVACATPQGGQFETLLEGTSEVDRDGDVLTITSPEGRLRLVRR
ncbi:MAG: META domain-containing protein [Vicinamibacteria bacterium]